LPRISAPEWWEAFSGADGFANRNHRGPLTALEGLRLRMRQRLVFTRRFGQPEHWGWRKATGSWAGAAAASGGFVMILLEKPAKVMNFIGR
ncbi:MAG: hypothetical protein ABSG04_11715, partial [Verrucomicrobiota bacterium]